MLQRVTSTFAVWVLLGGCGGVKEDSDAGHNDGPLPDKVVVKPDIADTGPAADGELDRGTDATDAANNCGNTAIDTGEKCDGLNLAGWTCKAKGFAGGTLKCKKDCTDHDTSGCFKCGDNKISAGEKCDGTNLASWTCKALGFDGGTLKCKKDCTDLDKSGCTRCGDFVKNGAEECDGADVGKSTCKGLGYFGGKLACDAKCKLVKTACTNCGNAKVDSGEQCDGKNLSSKTCKTEGFDGGQLKCSAACTLDKSSCTKTTCPNGKLDAGEDCEGTNLNKKKCADLKYAGGTLACFGNCKYDTSKCYKCGDSNINTGEKCDGKNLGGWSCKALNYDGGALTCKADCKDLDKSACYKCGDAKKNGTEQCDAKDLGGKACKDVGFYVGTLTCKKDCTLDTAQCTNCGNAKIETGEECDGTNLNKKTCKDFKFDKGTLKCSSACLFDKSGCQSIKCGDGKVEGAEQCEPKVSLTKTCKDLGYDNGTLACSNNCKFDAAKCHKCGDGKIGGKEKCDTTALAGKTCASFSPFHSGTLKCKSDCSDHDTSACNKCGDKVINGTEKCDGTSLGLATCKSLGFDGGMLACTSGCLLDTAKCHKCGDGKISGAEKCDGSQLGSATCKAQGFDAGTLKCGASCALDTSGCTYTPRYLADEFFADFSKGALSESGAKLYVSAKGNVQMLDRHDLNGDGYLDIVFSNSRDGNIFKINSFIYWGSVSGPTVTKKTGLPTIGAFDSLGADLDDDGYVDLLFNNNNDGSTTVVNSYIYWGSLAGFSTSSRTLLPTKHSNSSAVADLNSDGYLDLVVTNATSGPGGYARIYWGAAAGFSSSHKTDLTTTSNDGVTIADLDKDGYLDIITSAWGHSAKSYIYWGSKSGFSQTKRAELPTKNVFDVTVADLDGNGYLDIVYSNNHDMSNNLLLNSYIYWGSTSGFKASKKTELPTRGAAGISVADLNKDGNLDLVFSNVRDGSTWKINSYIYWGSSAGAYSPKSRAELPTVGTLSNCVLDLNNDTYPDIVFSNYHDGAIFKLNSYIYWGSATGYTAGKRAELPTLGAARLQGNPGSLYDRKPVQTFTSRVMDAVTTAPAFDQLSVKATVPKNTTLKLQVRSAATASGVSTATWYGPTSTSDHYTAATGTKTFTLNAKHKGHRYIQYLAVFSHDFGSTPVLDRVEFKFHSTASCSATSCSDKKHNGCETDVDCGGEACNGCADGKKCKAGSDCLSGVCTSGVCKSG